MGHLGRLRAPHVGRARRAPGPKGPGFLRAVAYRAVCRRVAEPGRRVADRGRFMSRRVADRGRRSDADPSPPSPATTSRLARASFSRASRRRRRRSAGEMPSGDARRPSSLPGMGGGDGAK